MLLEPNTLGCIFYVFSGLLISELFKDSAVFLIEVFEFLLLHRQVWCAAIQLWEPQTTYRLKF